MAARTSPAAAAFAQAPADGGSAASAAPSSMAQPRTDALVVRRVQHCCMPMAAPADAELALSCARAAAAVAVAAADFVLPSPDHCSARGREPQGDSEGLWLSALQRSSLLSYACAASTSGEPVEQAQPPRRLLAAEPVELQSVGEPLTCGDLPSNGMAQVDLTVTPIPSRH